MKRLFVLLMLLFSAVLSYGEKKDPVVVLDPDDTLYIVVIDNMYDDDLSQRHHHFREAFDELTAEVGFPMSYVIVRFGARVPKNLPCAYLTIHKWAVNRVGGIDVRLSGYLRDPKSWNKVQLGMHVANGALVMGHIQQEGQIRKNFNTVMKKALLEVIGRIETLVDDGSPEMATPVGGD